jgi:hypothetical protein
MLTLRCGHDPKVAKRSCEVNMMEGRRQNNTGGDVASIQHEILAQLDRVENAGVSTPEMNREIGKLRELHQVLVYKIEILKRIKDGRL